MPDGRHLADQFSQVRKAVEDAYQRGLHDGAERARQSIFTASQIPFGPFLPTPAKPKGGAPGKKRAKAPRGSIAEALDKILADGAGFTLPELEKSVPEVNNLIAPKSVYNHLTDKEGTLYRREGGKWFRLVNGEAAAPPTTATTVATPAAAGAPPPNATPVAQPPPPASPAPPTAATATPVVATPAPTAPVAPPTTQNPPQGTTVAVASGQPEGAAV